MLIALTREVSSSIVSCQLTHIERAAIDIDLARAQHHAYERALEEAGCTIVRVEAAPGLSDVPVGAFGEQQDQADPAAGEQGVRGSAGGDWPEPVQQYPLDQEGGQPDYP